MLVAGAGRETPRFGGSGEAQMWGRVRSGDSATFAKPRTAASGFHATWVMRASRAPNETQVTPRRTVSISRRRQEIRTVPSRTGTFDLARWRGPALAVSASSLFLAACNSAGQATFTFWDVIWTMVAFFFWFMLIWIFISIFADIFRRNDLTGGWKAIWIIVIFIIPFFGALIYIISRPKVTAQDVQMMTQADAAVKAAAGVTPADQIEKLNQLKESGAITVPEYEALKQKAMEG